MFVVIESPYSDSNGRSIAANTKYAQECMRDSIGRGEAPFASHLLYPQVLNEALLCERMKGIALGYTVGELASKVAVYVDYGRSNGMNQAIEYYREQGKQIEYRTIIKMD